MSLLRADARALPLRDGCVQCVVTSPPYFGLRDYGIAGQIGLEPTPDSYVAELVAVFREVRRVLRDDGTLWLNLGDSYAASMSNNGGYSEKSTLAGFSNANTKGRQANESGERRRIDHGVKPKDLIGIPWRVAFALQADGWYLRSDIIWAKPNPMPESVTDRPTKSHEYVFLLTKAARYFWDAEAVAEDGAYCGQQLGIVRGRKVRALAMGRQPSGNEVPGADALAPDKRNIRSVWSIATQPYPEAHFATFPEALAERCIKAGSRPGDLVLDPFGGSGTVAQVARRLNRRAVCTELNPAYLALAQRRIREQQVSLLETDVMARSGPFLGAPRDTEVRA